VIRAGFEVGAPSLSAAADKDGNFRAVIPPPDSIWSKNLNRQPLKNTKERAPAENFKSQI
jgi:hypothetical protein